MCLCVRMRVRILIGIEITIGSLNKTFTVQIGNEKGHKKISDYPAVSVNVSLSVYDRNYFESLAI